MVQSRIGQNVVDRKGRARLWIECPEHQSRNAGVNHRARTHHAWLERAVHGRGGKPIVAGRPCRFSESDHFGMSRRIARRDWLIERTRNDRTLENDYCADRDLARAVGIPSLCKSHFHVLRVKIREHASMLHLFRMKFAAFLLCLMPVTLFAQGVRMSGDFLPLEVGNRWVYDIVNESGQKIGSVDFSIKEHRIIGGRSYYVLSGFPFTPDDGSLDRLIRYDRQERQYMRMLDNEEGPLFLADGATAEVLQADDSGLPLKFILRMDLFDLTFQRGVGVIEARIHGGNAIQIAKLSAMRVGGPPPTAEASLPGVVNPNAPPPPPRSEERRVGKECRTRRRRGR